MMDGYDGNLEEILPDGNLPEDLIVSILLKLPVKSLLKFESVCKIWRSLISSPGFIKLHLHGNSIAAQRILLAIWEIGGEEYSVISKNHATGDDALVSRIHCPFASRESELIPMLNSCNGLVCLGRSELNGTIRVGPLGRIVYRKFLGVILWNPATRKYWSCDVTSNPSCPSFLSAGLGYVEATNDYKVVGVASIHRDTFRTEVYVYALSSGGCKKLLDYDCSDLSFGFYPPITVDGRMHWMASRGGSRNLIVAFDIAHEVMHQSMIPDNYGSVSEITRQIFAIRDCLAMLIFHKVEVKSVEVWVMAEYGVQGSWAKQFNIDAIPYVRTLPAFSWKDGELVFRCGKDDYLTFMAYDPVRKTRKYYSEIMCDSPFKVFDYVESLTSFEGAQGRDHSAF